MGLADSSREGRDESQLMTWGRRAAMLLAAGSLVVALICVDHVFTHDGPQHLYSGYVLGHIGQAPYATHYESNMALVAYGVPWLYSVLASVLPWRIAAALLLTIVSLSWGMSCVVLARAIAPARWPLGLLGFATALQWALWMGFFNYLAGVSLGFFVVALGLARHPWSLRTRLLLATLLLTGTAIHPFGAHLAGLGLGLIVLTRTRLSRLVPELAWLLVMALPVLLLTLVTYRELMLWGAQEAMLGRTETWLPWRQRFENFGACFVSGPALRAWPPVLLGLAGMGCFLGSLRRRVASSAELVLAAVAIVTLVLGLVTPWHSLGWQFASPRFLPVAVTAGCMLVPLERVSFRARWLCAASILAFVLGANAWAGLYNRQLATQAADALAGLDDAPHRSGQRLPIVLDPLAGSPLDARARVIPYAQPLRNLGHLYAMDHGGVVPYTFSGSKQLHVISSQFGAMPRVPNREYWQRLLETPQGRSDLRSQTLARLGFYGTLYDDIMVWGRPDDVDVFLARGYVADYRQGTLLLAHFEGCPARLRIEGEGLGESSHITAVFAWAPARTPAGGLRFASEKLPYTKRIPRAPCGAVWISLESDNDRAVACRGAEGEGRWLAHIDKPDTTLTCQLIDHGAKD